MTKPKDKKPVIRPAKEVISDVNKRRAALEKAYSHALALLAMDIKEAQATCKHEKFTFVGDAAGGNDSFHQCDDCGHQW